MDKERLKEILESHGKWLKDEGGGERANLCGANLRGADLCEANLSEKIIQVGRLGAAKAIRSIGQTEILYSAAAGTTMKVDRWTNSSNVWIKHTRQRIKTRCGIAMSI
jgi:hypothetical protein